MAEEKDFITEAEKLAYDTNTLNNVNIVEGDDEFLDPEGFKTGEQKATYVSADETGLDVNAPIASDDLGNIESTKKIGDVGAAEGAKGTVSDDALVKAEDTVGMVSDQSQVDAEAMQEELDPRATTSYQLGNLMKSIEQGKPLPPWASPAVRRVSAIMQSRGMGSGSMASAAMLQAMMESGIPIASKDADAFASIQIKSLDGKQKAALQNAVIYAQMDTTNANNRTKAAIQNAQNFLAMDVENLKNDQTAQMASYEANTQAMFNDVAAENVTIQLNAKNETQVEQFFAEIGSQVEVANKNRMVAMKQFNTSEENSMNQYNTSVADARSKFNTNMKYAIEQSDTKWRRDINTANTATQNETNRINIQNLIGKQMAALQSLAQEFRDDGAYNFQKSESYLQKKHEIGMLAMEYANSNKLYSKEQKDLVASKVGEWVANLIAYGGD